MWYILIVGPTIRCSVSLGPFLSGAAILLSVALRSTWKETGELDLYKGMPVQMRDE